MQHNHAAKLLISKILEMPILELELKPQELVSKVHLFSVYRVDFKAKITTDDGQTMVVLIELQKIKFHTSTFRFRKYLAEQYLAPENMQNHQGIPIFTIYILGHHLTNLKHIPIIRVKRQYLAHGTNEVLNEKDPFIEALTHDSIIIQLPALKFKKEKTELEQALTIFDLRSKHILDVNEEKYPDDYKEILKVLNQALVDSETEKLMSLEDEILEELRIREEQKLSSENLLQEKLNAKEKELKEKEILLEEEKKRAEEEKKRAEEKERLLAEEKKRAEEEKKRAEEKERLLAEEKKRAEEEKLKIVHAIQNLKEKGFTDEQIENLLSIKISDYI
jgi:hypothetical protein